MNPIQQFAQQLGFKGNPVENAANKLKDMATSLLTPRNISSNPVENINKYVVQPGIESAKGMARTAGFKTDDQGKIQWNPLNIATHAWNDPIETAGSVLMGKGAMGAMKGASALPEEASNLPPIQNAADTLPSDAVANYQSVFQVPSAYVNKMNIKPDAVVKTLINDGVTNIKSLDHLKSVTDSVTGENGVLPRINRIMLGDIKQPINYFPSENPTYITDAIDSNLEGAKPYIIKDVKAKIQGALPKYDQVNNPVPIGYAHAEDLFNATQKLRDIEYMYRKLAYDVNGDVKNTDYQAASQAVQDVKNNINDILDQQIPPDQYEAYKADPRITKELSNPNLPQGVKSRFLNNAHQFSDGRHMQADYVAASKLIDLTKSAKNTAFAKAFQNPEAPRSEQISNNIANVVRQPLQTAGNVVQGVGQKVLSRFDKTPDQLFSEKTSGVSPMSGGSATLKPLNNSSLNNGIMATNLVKNTLPPIVNSSNQNKEDTTTPQNTPNRYTFNNPMESKTIMSEKEYGDQVGQLQKKIGQEKINDPIQAAQDQGTLDALNSKYSQQKDLRDQTTRTLKIQNGLKKVEQDVSKAPPDPSQFVAWIDKVRKGTDKNYAQLTASLKYLETNMGADFSQIKSKDALIGALNGVWQNVLNEQSASEQQYTGQAPSNINVQSTTNLPPITSTPQQPNLPAIGQPTHYNFHFGSAGENIPQ